MSADIIELLKLAAQHGIAPLILLGGLVWYIKKEKPRRDAQEDQRERERHEREMERDRIQAERLKDQVEENRTQRREAAEREDRIRRDHAEAWAAERAVWVNMINQVSTAIDRNTEGTERNWGLLLAIGRNQGMSRRDMISQTADILGREIASGYETKDEEPKP